MYTISTTQQSPLDGKKDQLVFLTHVTLRTDKNAHNSAETQTLVQYISRLQIILREIISSRKQPFRRAPLHRCIPQSSLSTDVEQKRSSHSLTPHQQWQSNASTSSNKFKE